MSLYDFIKNEIFGEEDFEKLLKGEKIDHGDEEIDISPGSGWHYRKRGRYVSKLGKDKKESDI
jgi:hypothetical protein